MCEIFQRNGLKITIRAKLKVIDFLDVTFNLENDTYKPYVKPNNTLLYVNVNSNHPPSIIRNIPENINKRLSDLSKTEDIFQNSIGPYQEALEKAGHKFKFKYSPQAARPRNRGRQRNIIWFNPPYCNNVKTDLGKEFLKILDKCFPKNSKF